MYNSLTHIQIPESELILSFPSKTTFSSEWVRLSTATSIGTPSVPN